jgi:peptide/nickel transport system permease protein
VRLLIRTLFSWRLAKEIARYVLRLAGTIAGASLAVFLLIEISISGGFRAVVFPSGPNLSSERDRALVEIFHLETNVVQRWISWMLDGLQGEFGFSLRARTSVWELVGPRLSISGELMLVGVVATILIGVPMGLLAAAWSRRRAGKVVDSALGLSQSLPVFVTPYFLIWLFALELRWLPAASWVRPTVSLTDHFRHLALPVIALVLAEFGAIGRIVRADVLKVLEEDYIVSAMSKGLSTRFVLFRHALRPASLGLLNIIGLNIGSMLSGAVIIELIFGIGGLGRLLFESTINRDLNLILALTTYFVVVFVTLNSIVDVLMRVLDPRLSER